MPEFEIIADFKMTGDQPQAVEKLVEGLGKGYRHQTLLGVTGSGKTFTMANVIEKARRPTLVISHNKTLAAQLYQEFREFFPNNAVEYFVSYYDYYQPEAYVPKNDLYIEKDADINDEIDKLRHAATRALFQRRDVIIVASVSCIYGLGEPEEYYSFVCSLKKGESYNRYKLLHRLVEMQYERNDIDFARGRFRVRGDTLEVQPAYEELALRNHFGTQRGGHLPGEALRYFPAETGRGDSAHRGRARTENRRTQEPGQAARGSQTRTENQLRYRNAA
jgi:excinuclease ABC subunit B